MKAAGIGAVLLFLAVFGADAQDAPAGDTLRITPAWDATRFQPWDAPLVLTLSRPLRADDGRIAVIVGRADLSALLVTSGVRISLPVQQERLPSGDLEVIAYQVSINDEWRELGRFPLRRLTRAGFESSALRPSLSLQSEGLLKTLQTPEQAAPPGDGMLQEFALNASLDATLRRGTAETVLQGLLQGATADAARLRSAQLGPRAPPVDLATYNLRYTRQRFDLAAGHVGLGNHRLLVNQFRSRGVLADIKLAQRVQATLAGAAGSEIVGWDDPLGLRRPTHRILTGSLGIEAVPTRPGLLRLDFTTVDGSIQPIPAFNQAAINDRQESSGLGWQLAAAHPSGRVRAALGMARSRFAQPHDPQLSGDSTLVPVRTETRNARFGELLLDVMRNLKLGPTHARLAVSARHERIDPQYASVALPLQADREQNVVELTGGLGALQLQYGVTRARDNLAGISSLLTTNTAAQTLNAALPVAQLLGANPAQWWWPSFSASWQAVHQAGEDMPENGGFRLPSQVPDQRTSNLTVAATWQYSIWNLAWRYGSALVDNRAPTREQSDFQSGTQGLTLGIAATKLSLALDLARETMHNVEVDQRTSNDRVSVQGTWRLFSQTMLNGAYSLTLTNDRAATMRGRNSEVRLEASQGFNLYVRPQNGSQARIFVRYLHTSSSLRSAGVLQPGPPLESLQGGVSFRLF